MENWKQSVALVGRPNVGKSRLFNRLVRKRVSIVFDKPGVTRDVISAPSPEGYTVLDTGGIGLPEKGSPGDLLKAVDEQVAFALQAAAVVVFVVDAREGLNPIDEESAERLRKRGGNVILAVNKVDGPDARTRSDEFFKLGLRPIFEISAEHNYGIADLISGIQAALPEVDLLETLEAEKPGRRINLCLAGRPNVGKSSRANRLLASDRLIVSSTPGTTRDAVDLDLDYLTPEGKTLQFRLTDTAGLRPTRKVDNSVEFFSSVRTRDAIERADVVFLLIDALDGITRQEKRLTGEVLETGKPLIVLVNKWDLAREQFKKEPIEGYESIKEFREAYEASLRKELFFIPRSPVFFGSATEGFGLDALLREADRLHKRAGKSLTTGQLNRAIQELVENRPPRKLQGKRFRIYYTVQTGNRPYRIRVFCNQEFRLEDTYSRYLEHGLIEAFDLAGCPVRFDLVGKEQKKPR